MLESPRGVQPRADAKANRACVNDPRINFRNPQEDLEP